MSMGSFSYLNENEPIYDFRNYKFQIKNNSKSTAFLHFINNYGEKIDIPSGFEMYSSGERLMKYENSAFIISWIENYELRYRNNTIWKLTNQKQQSVYSVNRQTSLGEIIEESSEERS
jgi:hypothetical protein